MPFCTRKCAYCDFYSRPFSEAKASSFVSAAIADLARHGDELATELASVFVGGGTPTCLPPHLLDELLMAIKPLVGSQTEFTVEANPGTIDPPLAEVLRQCGVNRVSLGVQSFDAGELKLLGRIHTPAEAREAALTLKESGIANISIDLIYGIPSQSLSSWRRSVEQGLELPIEHMSCYALSFEPATPLDRLRRRGQIAEIDESLQRSCYYAAIDAAANAGFEHYEISNFARTRRQCRHNLTYWHNQPYLGIGPAAASYIAGVRRTNLPDLDAYVAAIGRRQPPPATSERLTGRKAMAETIMLTLRLTDGLDRAQFAARYGQDAMAAFPASIRRYADLGALVVTPRRIRLSKSTLFLSDTVLADIIAEA